MIRSAIEAKIERAESYRDGGMMGEYWAREFVTMARELLRWQDCTARESNEIEQMIAKLFPDQYPLYPPDWGAGFDRCVGEHTPVTLVMELVRKYRDLRDQMRELESHGRIVIDSQSLQIGGVSKVQLTTVDKRVTGSTLNDAIFRLGEA